MILAEASIRPDLTVGDPFRSELSIAGAVCRHDAYELHDLRNLRRLGAEEVRVAMQDNGESSASILAITGCLLSLDPPVTMG